MYAVRQHAPGGLSGLVYEEIETPQPGPGEALVRVHAAAITRDELAWTSDRLPATPSFELSGVVAAVGPEVGDVAVEDPVYALTDFEREGVAAEYAVVSSRVLAPKPTTVGHVESAAIPLAALSAWQGLFNNGGLTKGQRALIQGAAGGVGHFAVQLARHRGAYVIGTTSAGSDESVRGLGADEVLTAIPDAFEPVDLVFDTVGGERLERAAAILRPGGRLVSVAEEPPQEPPGISSIYFVVEPSREQLVELAKLVDGGKLRPTIDAVFPLSECRQAFERTLSDRRRGKVVLQVVDE
jgi:NADPH:quinone reductase-like Zn-dependent oxidoreductase